MTNISSQYYALKNKLEGYKMICFYCLEDCEPAMEDEKYLKQFKSFLPRCEDCKVEGREAYSMKNTLRKDPENVKNSIEGVKVSYIEKNMRKDTGNTQKQKNIQDDDHLTIKKSNHKPNMKNETISKYLKMGEKKITKKGSSLLSSLDLDISESKGLEKLFQVKNVPADGNCCLYVALRWLMKSNKIRDGNINNFRKSLRHHMSLNEMELTSKKYGVYGLYIKSEWKKLMARVWIGKKDYSRGCNRSGWVSMVDIYPILVHKFGFFKHVTLDKNDSMLYDMNECVNGLLKGFRKEHWIKNLMTPNKSFAKKSHLLLC